MDDGTPMIRHAARALIVRDAEVVAACDDYAMTMAYTGPLFDH